MIEFGPTGGPAVKAETDERSEADTWWYVGRHASGGKLACRSSYLSRIITGVPAAR